jgi:hypothetical protein
MPPVQKMAALFDKVDVSGSGSISKAQIDAAFKSTNPPPSIKALGADSLWAKLDPSGTGSVSKQDFTNVMTALRKGAHVHHHGSGNALQSPSQTAGESLGALNALGSHLGNNINTKI